MTTAPPLYQGIIGLAISIAPTLVAPILVHRRRVDRLVAATGLVLWGLLIVILEHATFGVTEFGGGNVLGHTRFHFQMLAAYGLAAFALVGVVVAPLIRRGEPVGWFGLLVLVVIGVGAEVATAVVTTPHGVPPRFWSWGLFLWGYPAAWMTALALSYRPIIRPGTSNTGEHASRPATRNQDGNTNDRAHPFSAVEHPAQGPAKRSSKTRGEGGAQ